MTDEDNSNLLFPGLPTPEDETDRKRVPTLSNRPADDPAADASHSLRAASHADAVADD
ncbi:hypothetical protein G9C85_10265 [Halorubellus sp. JP-L1]|uniref:hypothetical protein n=1 Tax=Halorubellus sp. JP-L1 TaxID=2715753 RepID=UPI0014074136|nr:hypothetical protein [Halorubellus sp. JP-L1]NHN42010.1 hypothetical protein [Halorubellus sp. JP-L1]